MLTYFTVSSVLPRVSGSTDGMGLALAQALAAATASGAAPSASLAALAARNCIPAAIAPPHPLGGAALLDILV